MSIENDIERVYYRRRRCVMYSRPSEIPVKRALVRLVKPVGDYPYKYGPLQWDGLKSLDLPLAISMYVLSNGVKEIWKPTISYNEGHPVRDLRDYLEDLQVILLKRKKQKMATYHYLKEKLKDKGFDFFNPYKHG